MRTQLKRDAWYVTFQNTDADEVYGWFETEQRALIKGSGGWWRTSDPQRSRAEGGDCRGAKGIRGVNTVTQLQLDLPNAGNADAESVMHGYTIKRVTEGRLSIYNPNGHFVCQISSDDDPEDVIGIDRSQHARPAPKPGECRQRNQKTPGSSNKSVLPGRAPRGDLFREIAEMDRAAATVAQPDMHTPEDDRARVYNRLAEGAMDVIRGKKKLRGPINSLRRNATSNRRAEFDSWLRSLGLKGASMEVRYESLLAFISGEIDEIALDFSYTSDKYRAGGIREPTKDGRVLLERARSDIAEIPRLFRGMASLLIDLKFTKRYAVCPPPPLPEPSPEEVQAKVEGDAKHARAPRVEESRKWLREMCHKDKHSDADVRCRASWIGLDGILMMFRDDLTGYANAKSLWPSVPDAEQLSEDYGISRSAAMRVLAAYRESTTV